MKKIFLPIIFLLVTKFCFSQAEVETLSCTNTSKVAICNNQSIFRTIYVQMRGLATGDTIRMYNITENGDTSQILFSADSIGTAVLSVTGWAGRKEFKVEHSNIWQLGVRVNSQNATTTGTRDVYFRKNSKYND